MSFLLKYLTCVCMVLTLMATDMLPATDEGTLIITYGTGANRERLDRVRFWIKDDKAQAQMYPKNGNYVDDQECLSRMVVLENVPAGEYNLEFVIPNSDGLFEEAPKRTLTIQQNSVVKIDQFLKPRYASVTASVINNHDEPFKTAPTITLKDYKNCTISQATDTQFYASTLLPGNYTLVFEPLDGYTPPDAIKITAHPNDKLGPFKGIYSVRNNYDEIALNQEKLCTSDHYLKGTLLISYEISKKDKDELKNIRFRITEACGKQHVYPADDETFADAMDHAHVLYINLPVGTHTIEYFVEGHESLLSSLPRDFIEIKEEQITMLQKSFKVSNP